jgi:hypothetical protein
MLVPPCCSRNESKISWIQRRFPGHLLLGSGEDVGDPFVHAFCNDLFL